MRRKAGQEGLEAQEGGDSTRVDGEPALAPTLRHEFNTDAAICPRDNQFAELPEFFHRGELGLTFPDFDNLVGLVHEAVAAEKDFAADVVEEVGVFFHGGAHGRNWVGY